MPTYLYETLPGPTESTVERFEVRQRMDEPALEKHPTSGTPVRRVISGGMGMVHTSSDSRLPEPGPGCGPGSCGCGRF
jgi:predicted nucleic acid-binding Zn ribbon protein